MYVCMYITPVPREPVKSWNFVDQFQLWLEFRGKTSAPLLVNVLALLLLNCLGFLTIRIVVHVSC